jgi:cell division protein FtsL
VANLSRRAWNPEYVDECARKEQLLTHLQQQTIELTQAVHETHQRYQAERDRSSGFQFELYREHSDNRCLDAAWKLNLKLAEWMDQITEKSPVKTEPSCRTAVLVADLEKGQRRIHELEENVQQQRQALEVRDGYIAQLRSLIVQQENQTAGCLPAQV